MIIEWLRKEIIDDNSKLKEYLFILKYIIGYRGDGYLVVKVFFCNYDEKV